MFSYRLAGQRYWVFAADNACLGSFHALLAGGDQELVRILADHCARVACARMGQPWPANASLVASPWLGHHQDG